jgi:DNA helicase-2/ATP-dependent DNA helicase PcrA
MENTLLKSLNPEQQAAVKYCEGPSIILAGAGSGKTRVLTYKVLYLIQEYHVSPSEILMVTFTNKAAQEMRERMTDFLETENIRGEQPLVTTFHSLGARLLRRHAERVGLSPSFAIYDSSDQLDAVKQCMAELGISPKDLKPGSAQATISNAKNELLDPTMYATFSKGSYQLAVAAIYTRYQRMLLENNAVDFDDLVLLTVKLLKDNADIAEKYQETFQYIMIDEYQDTNKPQYELTKLLAKKAKHVCVVGDFSQSIYSWRGADFRNLKRFETDFEGTKTFALSQNYRSTQKILDGASAVIKKNTSHPVLSLWTQNGAGEQLIIYEARDEQQEAEFIVKTMLEHGVSKLSDCAVLYRTNAQSRVIEEVLLHHGIPYTLIGGTRFYERKEVKDVLCYLRLLANPKDSVSRNRAEKLGKNRFSLFEAFASTYSVEKKEPTIETLDHVLEKTRYLELYDENDPEDRARLENIKELRSVAYSFPDLFEFLENVALVEKEYSQAGELKNAVTLMTLHAAKGLEFPIVFMIGMEEGIFPHSRSLMDKQELEEERRLCYVGITRAKNQLYLTFAKRRLFFGQRTAGVMSRFLFDLPEEIVIQHTNDIDQSYDPYDIS